MIRIMITGIRGLIRSLFRDKADLMIENIALRQQLAVFKNKKPRPRLKMADRIFWIALKSSCSKWIDALIIVKPETVIKWHRQGFRLLWRWKSKSRNIGRPRISKEIRDLILQMARENGWGATKIHGELLKLGYNIHERTVSRYLPKGPTDPDSLKRWMVFLRNHLDCMTSMDFFTVPTVSFQIFYVFFIIHHYRRKIVYFAVTRYPNVQWIIQQLREAFPYDTAPRYMILDRDGKYGKPVPKALERMGIEKVQTAYRAPWQNPYAERMVGTLRRELLDHVIVFGEKHLHWLFSEYIDYYHEDRTHLGLDKDTPNMRAIMPKPSVDAKIVSIPRVGGLHHRYEWRKAA